MLMQMLMTCCECVHTQIQVCSRLSTKMVFIVMVRVKSDIICCYRKIEEHSPLSVRYISYTFICVVHGRACTVLCVTVNNAFHYRLE